MVILPATSVTLVIVTFPISSPAAIATPKKFGKSFVVTALHAIIAVPFILLVEISVGEVAVELNMILLVPVIIFPAVNVKSLSTVTEAFNVTSLVVLSIVKL